MDSRYTTMEGARADERFAAGMRKFDDMSPEECDEWETRYHTVRVSLPRSEWRDLRVPIAYADDMDQEVAATLEVEEREPGEFWLMSVKFAPSVLWSPWKPEHKNFNEVLDAFLEDIRHVAEQS